MPPKAPVKYSVICLLSRFITEQCLHIESRVARWHLTHRRSEHNSHIFARRGFFTSILQSTHATPNSRKQVSQFNLVPFLYGRPSDTQSIQYEPPQPSQKPAHVLQHVTPHCSQSNIFSFRQLGHSVFSQCSHTSLSRKHSAQNLFLHLLHTSMLISHSTQYTSPQLKHFDIWSSRQTFVQFGSSQQRWSSDEYSSDELDSMTLKKNVWGIFPSPFFKRNTFNFFLMS